MAEESTGTPEADGKKDRQKPNNWLFPRLPLRDVKFLSAKLAEVGQGEKMRRTLLLDACDLHDSGPTREKLIVSQVYGLTKGGTSSEFIEPTELGESLMAENAPASMLLDIISKNEYFKKFHDRYAGKRVPAEPLFIEWAKQVGVPDVQSKAFSDVVVKNAADAGLIARRSGADNFVSFEEALELHQVNPTPKMEQQRALAEDEPRDAKQAGRVQSAADTDRQNTPRDGVQQVPPSTGFSPTIHIDVQVHISPESSPEQINAIFAGMAKHLYGRESD